VFESDAASMNNPRVQSCVNSKGTAQGITFIDHNWTVSFTETELFTQLQGVQ
jgi:hypothetical protein